jgi:hypothetical protein
MTMHIATHAANEGSLFLEELDQVDAWSLDELAQCSDLESVRSAWGHADHLES